MNTDDNELCTGDFNQPSAQTMLDGMAAWVAAESAEIGSGRQSPTAVKEFFSACGLRVELENASGFGFGDCPLLVPML